LRIKEQETRLTLQEHDDDDDDDDLTKCMKKIYFCYLDVPVTAHRDKFL